MDISYEEFRGLSQELTDKEVCIAQLRNELEATREKLEEERLKNSVLQDENYMLKAQRDKVEFENSVLRKYILLSKEKIAEFVKTLRNINHWAFLRAFVLWALPEEYRDLEMACVDEVMGLPMDNPTGIVMNQPTFQGPMYDVHDSGTMEKMKDSSMMGVTFNGNVTFNGPMFDIHDNKHVHIGVEDGVMSSRRKDGGREMDPVQLARAIENCQQYFWGNSAYAVVFCVCRDAYKMQPNKTAFEKMVEQLPFQGKRDYKCPLGTIANAFSDNLIFNENVNDWEQFGPLPRIVKLRDELRRELKL